MEEKTKLSRVLVVENGKSGLRAAIKSSGIKNRQFVYHKMKTDSKPLDRLLQSITPGFIILSGEECDEQLGQHLKTIRECTPGVPVIYAWDKASEKRALELLKAPPPNKKSVDKDESFPYNQWADQEDEKKLRLILENIMDVITITDLEGNFLYTSPNNKQQSGYEAHENIGLNGFELVHPEDQASLKEGRMKLLNNPGKTFSMTYRHLRKDGSWYWLETKGKLVKKKGKDPFIILSSRDVTERKKAEMEIRKLSLTVEQNPASILITNTRGEIEYVNPKLEEVSGYRKKELLGKNPRIFKSEASDMKVYREMWRNISSGIPWKGELYNKKKNGQLFWERVWIIPVKNNKGQITNYLGIKEDIDEIKRNRLFSELSYKIASISNKTHKNLHDLLDQIHNELSLVIKADNFYIALYNNNTYSFPYFKDSGSKTNPNKLDLHQSLTDYVRRTEEALLFDRKKRKKLLASGKITLAGKAAKIWMGVPLKNHGKTIGVLAVQSYHNETDYDKRDLSFLEYVSGQIASAIEKQRMQEILANSERMYRSLTEYASDITLVLGSRGEIKYISESVDRLFNVQKEKMIGRSVFSLVHRDDLKTARKMFSRWKKGDTQNMRATFRFRRADGQWRVVEAGASNFIKDNQVNGLIINALDVTERFHAQQNLLLLTRRLELMHEMDRAIQRSVSSEEIANNALRIIKKIALPFDRACIALFDMKAENACVLSVVNRSDTGSHVSKDSVLPLQSFRHMDRLKKGKSYIVNDLASSDRLSVSDKMLLDEGYLAYMVYPLFTKTELLGALILDSCSTDTFGEEQLELVSRISSQLSLAIKESMARLELTESEQLMRIIYDQAPVGIARMNDKCEFLMVNQKLCEIFGYAHKRLLNSSLFDITHSDDIAVVKDTQQQFMTGKIKRNFQFSKRYIHKQGHTIFVNAMFAYIKQEEEGYYIAVFENITNKIKSQNKLEALNKELNTFVYKASHDLKGPLASISGLTHMGLERVQDENAAQYFEMIQASVKRLDDTLIELLELSKSTNATIHLEEIDIKAFINSIQESVSHAEYSKGIEIKKEILIKQKIFTDKDILTSSLQNLLINAMKYHRREEPKKWIRIKAYNADTNKGIFITVEDNGTGIPDEIKDKIFNMFYRGNEASDGTGLGLYIVKKNVEKLGGEITLKDSKSGGALFSIYLPN